MIFANCGGVVTGLCLLAVAASGGPISPPAGAVGATGKTLTEVEPRTAVNATNTPGDADSLLKITQPGSYYLTGSITGVVGKHGIEITSSGVTLDLNGFDLVGVAAMGSFDGVSATVGALRNITVVNGTIRNWGDEGVDLGTSPGFNSRVEGVLASGNGGDGIYVSFGSTVTRCATQANTGNGIRTGTGSSVANCTATGNSGYGINTGASCAVLACAAYSNTLGGISGGSGSTITNCAANTNTANGITTAIGCTVRACTAYSNTGSGIVADNSTVADCTVDFNTLDGIQCGSACVISGNSCSANGQGDGAGIHATGADNRIEGNNCVGADRGIDVDAAGNIILRNTCSGNATNWDIVANNICGPILDRTVPASAAILGNSAPSSLGTTDPNANYSY